MNLIDKKEYLEKEFESIKKELEALDEISTNLYEDQTRAAMNSGVCLVPAGNTFDLKAHSDNIKCRNKILMMLKEVMEDTMQVYDFGAQKHPDSGDTPNFLTANGNKCSLEVRGNSCLHHAADTRAGGTKDKESGLHPALHLIASAAILYIRQKRDIIHHEDQKDAK